MEERERRRSGWEAWSGAAGLLCALAIVAEWAWHLARSIPPVSRSDHLAALWSIAPAVNEGRWAQVAAWVFEFTGGHVIGYARLLQLVNYLFFGYSGAFIKAAAIASFALTWAAIAFAVLRTLGRGAAAGLLLPWSAWLVCSPVLANLITWPEGTPPFLAPTLVAVLFVPWLAGESRRAIAAGTLATAFTNGSGFVFLPAALVVRLRRGQIAALAGLSAAGLAALVLLLWAMRTKLVDLDTSLPYAMGLGIVLQSLEKLFSHPLFFGQYYLALLALPFAPFRIVDSWPYGLAAALFAALVIAATDHRRPGPHRGWLVLAYFGLFAALVLGLGRYGYIDPSRAADAVITSHYAAVVLPLYVALGPLAVLAARAGRWPRRAAIGVFALALAVALVHKRAQVERDFTATARTELAIQFGSRNWNIYAAAASLGDTGVGQIALVRMYPELKAWNKYPELTRELVADPAGIGLAAARKDEQGRCGQLHAFAPDTRYPWATPLPGALLHSPQVLPFTRAVGYLGCDAEFVVMFGQDGQPQCVARPGPLATYFTEPELKARPGMGKRSFDFSCPGGNAAAVWAFDPARRVLTPVPLRP